VETYLRRADLAGANLAGANLRRADLINANLARANLEGATLNQAYMTGSHLIESNLCGTSLIDSQMNDTLMAGAVLRKANLTGANLVRAELVDADLTDANLTKAALSKTHLGRANLTRAQIRQSQMIEANLTEAILTDSSIVDASVYGISAWSIRGSPAEQRDLLITGPGEPPITVDDLEVAQFMHLMIRNPKIRNVLDTVTRKAVLILGRFRSDRMRVLDTLRSALRERGFVPVIFNFDKPEALSLTETVTLLARMVRFIVADLTDPSSVPYELARIAPDVRVPIQTIIQRGQAEFSMFADLAEAYRWVFKPYEYEDMDTLCNSIDSRVIQPVEKYRQEHGFGASGQK
jgi:uncharacterized protein YjbI with pentapeptide repeats